MKRALWWFLVASAFLVASSRMQDLLRRMRTSISTDQSTSLEKKLASSPATQPMITMVGPLADYMHNDPASPAEAAAAPVRKPHPSDHVGGSPVGTSASVVNKTFPLTTTARFSFEVPPHAATPQLRGTYRSFLRRTAAESGDEGADVEVLLMSQQQGEDFVHGRSVDPLFSTEPSHDQDVNFGLPSTLDQPAKYCLVFRSAPGSEPRKLVQAEFRVDF